MIREYFKQREKLKKELVEQIYLVYNQWEPVLRYMRPYDYPRTFQDYRNTIIFSRALDTRMMATGHNIETGIHICVQLYDTGGT